MSVLISSVVIFLAIVIAHPNLISKMIDFMNTCISSRTVFDSSPLISNNVFTGSKVRKNHSVAKNSENSEFLYKKDKGHISIEEKAAHKTISLMAKQKTIYLIRHAESNENHRLQCLSRSLNRLGRLKLPSSKDITTSVELLDVKAQVDSDVSEKGNKQIEQLGTRLNKDNFVVEKGIELVAHSPLKRARQTSEGMLGCVTPLPSTNDESEWAGKKAETVNRVVELPCLAERTPMEWLPINHDAFMKRIADFEAWLEEQPEERIAIVGHSQYFKSMLGLSYKFGNCDVWRLNFQPSGTRDIIKSGHHIQVDGKTLQVIHESQIHSFEAIKEDYPIELSFDEEKKEEIDQDYGENIDLPRGWSSLANLYSYEMP